MDRGAWWATTHKVAKSQTRLKWFSTHACMLNHGNLKWLEIHDLGQQGLLLSNLFFIMDLYHAFYIKGTLKYRNTFYFFFFLDWGKIHTGFPSGSVVKNPPEMVQSLCWEDSPNPLQYSSLENPMDRGAWWATVHRVTNSWTWLKPLSMHACTKFTSQN